MAGRENVTLKDIAGAVGKSVATVSKALHDREDIAPETRQYIKRVAMEMGYNPNVIARRLQKQRAEALGLIFPLLSARQADPFFAELLAGIADAAAERNFDLLVSSRAPGPAEETLYRRMVGERRVDGLIVAHPRTDDWRLDFLAAEHIPFVAVGPYTPELDAPGVWVDTAAGLEQAVAHLAEQERRHLALIPPPPHLRFSRLCRETFSAATEAHGLRGQIAAGIEAFSQKEGYRAAQMLLAGPRPPDAIIACHDLVAMGAMAAAQNEGFEVGNDVAIIGFGDILLAEHAQPPLTTLHQPTYQMGQQAGRMLLDMLAGRPPSPRQVVIKPWLVIRQSSNLALWL
ncbi:MAG: LacI family transcriptional regulator [Caldilineae bacterium]|nr:MAG: LacI family transcriptional regulator [Caldilineae bacterium]